MRTSTALAAFACLLPYTYLQAQTMTYAAESYKQQDMLACQHSVQNLSDTLAQLDTPTAQQFQAIERAERLYASAKLRLRFAKYDSCIDKTKQAVTLLQPLLQRQQLAQPAQNQLPSTH